MLIEIPNVIVQEALDANVIQMKWSLGSVEIRSRQVEALEHHIGEIVSALIIKQYNQQLRLK